MTGLGPTGHIVVVDDVPGPEGWRVVCIPHGPIGARTGRTAAFLLALEHDYENGGGSL